MKYQETLAQRELVIEDLPKSQQKKIAELEKLVSKIEEIEADVDDESREEFAHTAPVQDNEQSIAAHIEELKKEAQISPDDFGNEEQEQEPIQSYPQEALEVEAEEEFEKQGERKPRKVNIPLVVMGVGALLLTWGAVNFFKERR